MDVLFGAQRADLGRWETRDFTPGASDGPCPGDHHDAYQRTVATEPAGEPLPNGPFRRVAASVLLYEVFPPELVQAVVRRPAELGDTLGARHAMGLGLSLFFASRVVARFDGPAEGRWRTGFTYRTLAGHPTLGEETFAVEKDLASGEVKVVLGAWSRPGFALIRLATPLARRRQRQVNL